MSNSNLKSAKFFCENCGAEVPQNARVCRHCGRFFSSVRCPQCGTTGGPNKFTNGCPTCGYAFNSEKSKAEKDAKADVVEVNAKAEVETEAKAKAKVRARADVNTSNKVDE